MSTTDTRAAFEAALRNKGATERELRHASAPYEGLYANPRVQMRWEGWQAATEAAKAEKAEQEGSEIRWCQIEGHHIGGRPTATDALEYAEQRLRDPEEMICCKSDMRLDAMPNIRELLSAAKATGTAGELSESQKIAMQYGQQLNDAEAAAFVSGIELGKELAARQPAPVVSSCMWPLIDEYARAKATYEYSTDRDEAERQRKERDAAKEALQAALAALDKENTNA